MRPIITQLFDTRLRTLSTIFFFRAAVHPLLPVIFHLVFPSPPSVWMTNREIQGLGPFHHKYILNFDVRWWENGISTIAFRTHHSSIRICLPFTTPNALDFCFMSFFFDDNFTIASKGTAAATKREKSAQWKMETFRFDNKKIFFPSFFSFLATTLYQQIEWIVERARRGDELLREQKIENTSTTNKHLKLRMMRMRKCFGRVYAFR